MRIDFAVRRGQRLSLTSLIDMIFLLLLFFMLSSTFTRFAEVELAAGKGGAAAVGEAPDVVITLSDGGWRINGAVFPAGQAGAELARLAAAKARSALVLARGDIDSQALVAAVEIIRRHAGLAVTIAR